MTSRLSEHEYEPIAAAKTPPAKRSLAPVVRITDTDVMPVADSDDSIDDPGRFVGAITLDGDLILPLDGTLEDSVMEGREMRHEGDTPEDEETVQEYQQRIEERFLQVKQMENLEQPVETVTQTPTRGPHKSFQKLRTQAGKLRSRLKGIQRPSFTFPSRKISKSPKSKPSSPVKMIEKPESKKISKFERLRMSLPDRPNFSKIHLPDRSKFYIKRPNINFPSRSKIPSLREQKRQRSTESSYGSRRNIFDFSTMPRLFRSKDSNVPSSKDSESLGPAVEVATIPRTRKLSRWAERFDETKPLEDDPPSAVERSRPWRQPSLEEPRLAYEIDQTLLPGEVERLTWEEMYKKELRESEEKMKDESDELDFKMDEHELELKLVHQELKLKAIQDEIDPRLYGDQTVYEDDSERAEPDSYEREDIDPQKMNFQPIDARDFRPRVSSLPHSEEDGSIRSDREVQSSGSSSERRRHGVIEELDSDEFFLRQRGISQEDMNLGTYLAHEIRDALRASTEEDERPTAPQRPQRSKSMRSSKENSLPPTRPKRERSIRRSQESFQGPGAKHRVVYRADSLGSQGKSSAEPLDDIVVVKPVRRKSRTSLQSQSYLDENVSSDLPPIVPARKKRAWTKALQEKRMTVPALDTDWPRIVNLQPSSSLPAIQKGFEDELQMMDEEDYIEPVPIVPKRRSRSRGTSAARDEDRTSHGAESLPEVDFEEDMPKDNESSIALPGYAVIEKKDKPPGAPPRRRRKFATAPRPKRPQRAYSTLGPPRPKTPLEVQLPMEGAMQSDHELEHFDQMEHLDKIQGRPLPAPPRPPRHRRGRSVEPSELVSTTEVYASTQTDPLPDDVMFEEEITQAKLIMAPSRSGSQIFISTERISGQTPPIPPLPVSQSPQEKPSKEEEKPAPVTESKSDIEQQEAMLGSVLERALRSNEPLRINSLEVSDLRVERLSVSQLEAYKIAASEIDAIVMSASEMTRKRTSGEEEEDKFLHPSLLRELLAIRSHLETVSENIQNQERAPSRQRTEDACTATSDERIDTIPAPEEEATAASKQTRPDPTPIDSTQSAHSQVLQVADEEAPPRKKPVRQSASPVRSLPPVISVTPVMAASEATASTPEAVAVEVTPQRAVISYTQRDPADPPSRSLQEHLGAADQAAPWGRGSPPREAQLRRYQEPGLAESFGQLLHVLRLSGARVMRHLVRQVKGRLGRDVPEEKVHEVELALCTLLLVVTGLIVMYLCVPHTIVHHHHHWDFFNPPKG